MLRPGSVCAISRMSRFASRHGIRVVGRGAGHTAFGESQHLAAIAFDLTTLDEIGPIAHGCITVGAGCRWNAVLPATLAEGLMPPVLPDYIGQTVGGTLSVGGIADRGRAVRPDGGRRAITLALGPVALPARSDRLPHRRRSPDDVAVLTGRGHVPCRPVRTSSRCWRTTAGCTTDARSRRIAVPDQRHPPRRRRLEAALRRGVASPPRRQAPLRPRRHTGQRSGLTRPASVLRVPAATAWRSSASSTNWSMISG